MMTAWRIREKITGIDLYYTVYNNCTQSYAPSYEQFLLVYCWFRLSFFLSFS